MIISSWSRCWRCHSAYTWWRHQMETFSALLALCAGNSPVTGEFPTQRPVTRSFNVFFDLRLMNRWVNIREAGDLRHQCVHFDVSVMLVCFGNKLKYSNYSTWSSDGVSRRITHAFYCFQLFCRFNCVTDLSLYIMQNLQYKGLDENTNCLTSEISFQCRVW